MKTSRFVLFGLGAALAVLLAGATVQAAASYGVNFDGRYQDAPLPLPNNDLFGPDIANQVGWNNVHAPMDVNSGPWNSTFGITDNAGANPLNVTIHMDHQGGNDGGGSGLTNIDALYHSGLRDNDGTITLTTAAAPFLKYSLFVYYGNNPNGGVFALDTNYKRFDDLTVPLNFSTQSIPSNGQLNGFSIVDTSSPSFSGSGTWAAISGGTGATWNAGSSWSSNPDIPGVTSSPHPSAATFSGLGTETLVTLDAAIPNLAALSFSNSSYTLSGSTLTLSNNNGASTATVTVSSGIQTIGSALALTSTADVNVSLGAKLNISGVVTGAGALLKSGSGILVLSGAGTNLYNGGTTVSAGVLAVTTSTSLPDNKPLTVGAGGTLVFDPSYPVNSLAPSGSFVATSFAPAASSVTAVPEPSTFALLFAGLVVGFGIWRKKK